MTKSPDSGPAQTSETPSLVGGGIIDLDALPFDLHFSTRLPADPDTTNRPRPVTGALFSRVQPTPVQRPRTVAIADEVAELLGFSPELLDSDDFAQVFSGNRVPVGADPHATCYGGHQFGTWAGQLGDGRAISYGEVRDVNGDLQTLQLKGAGITPYSRGADGRAVLRSSLREFLCSEAMHHLGIPTTRALSLVLTGDQVIRDMLYDGNPEPEPGAVVCRVAPTFTRFGHFQLPSARGDLALTRQLVEYTIATDFPHLEPSQIVAFFAEVTERTMSLVIDWMRVGFVHGVLNTDNMSILGLTIDYGPYGWLEDFDLNWTPNTTDATGRRYRFGAQPQIAIWNLAQLANSLVELAGTVEPFQEILDEAQTNFGQRFKAMMVRRLGWQAPLPADGAIVDELVTLLGSAETDYLIFCRALAETPIDPATDDDDLLAAVSDAWYRPEQISDAVRADTVSWLRRWAQRSQRSGMSEDGRIDLIRSMNPKYVLRNYLAQEAIDAATDGDFGLVHELLDVLRTPYQHQPGRERFAQKRPEWARSRVGCSQLSCSS